VADDDALDDVPTDEVQRENWDGETNEEDLNADITTHAQEPGEDAEESSDEEDPDVRELFLDWLTTHLRTVEVVGTKPTPWCAQWWLHPEVVARFKSLWQASMQADASVQDGDAGAVSSWWINHWDRHAAVIFDKSTGPFRDCDPDDGHLHRRKDKTSPIVSATRPPDNVEL